MRSVVVALALSLAPGVAHAQSPAEEPATRAEALRAEREAKANALEPYTPNALERGMSLLESRGLFLIAREGFFPKLGSLTTGSGFAYGVGYRDRDLLRHSGIVEVFAAASLQKYWALDARALFTPPQSRYYAEAFARRREYPSEDFFGLGPDTRRADRTNFMLRQTSGGGRAGIRPTRWLLTGGGVEFFAPRASRGRSSDVPSVEEVFSPGTVPGLWSRANFLRTHAFLEVDYREPRNARRGGWYRLDFSHFNDRTSGQFTFDRVDADVRQYIGMLAGRRIIALRGWVSSAVADDGRQVPFYLMPYLGGNDTLRGFREYRFRAPHAMLLQAEYRWEVWSALDAALFYDAGKVAFSRRHLNFDDLQSDYGFGFRFNTDNGVVMRIDAGFGSRDGKHLYITFGGVF
ncbi:MAG: BamA/TamA family outer membrane protein [Acidobacteriota bacterium]